MLSTLRREQMSELPIPSRPPLVLIANDQEWSARSLESILGPAGYAVLRAYTGRQALVENPYRATSRPYSCRKKCSSSRYVDL